MLPERLREARTCFHAALDVHHQAREARILVSAGDDLECLQQRHACLEHRCQLAGEEGDVPLVDPSAAAEGLPAQLRDSNALPPQVGVDDRFGGRLGLATNMTVVAVDALPQEGVFLDLTFPALRN